MTCRKTILFLSIFLQSLTIFAQRTAVVVAPDFDVTNPANRAKYEHYIESHPFSKRKHYSKQELKAIPKQDRPDLAWEQDFLRTLDPALGRPAPERLIEAYNAVEQYQANQMGIPGSSAIPWIERGPNNVGGRTRAIVFDPNDTSNKKVWAGGVTGGLWYNTDITNASSQWIAVNDFWDNLAVTAIAFDPNDSQTIYVGTGEGFGAGSSRGAGVWKSTNGGSSFSQLSATDDFYYVNDLVVRDEGGSSVLYVGVSEMYYQGGWQGTATYYQGLFRSTNAGTIFSQVMPTTGTAGSYYSPADIEIAANNRIWVGTRSNSYGQGGGIILYSDNGTTWTVATDRGTNKRVEIACAPSDSNVVYAIIEASSQVDEIIKTTNGGATWTSSSSSSAITEPADADSGIPNTDFTRGQAWYDLICAVDPTDANMLYVGGIDLFRSTNAGLTWSQISKWSNNNNLSGLSCPLVHADQHAFVFRPGNNNQAVIGNDGGVYYASSLSTATSSSSAISHNVSYYNVTQYYACAMSPTSGSNVFLAGAQDNGTQRYSAVGINATTQVYGGDGAYCFIDQTDASQAIASYVYNSYYFSSNSGNSFGTSLLADQNTGSFINPADYDDNQNILYSCKDANSIYRINGIGSSPSTATVTISGMTAKASNIKVSPFTTTSSKLYIGTTGGNLFKVTSANSSTSPTATNITGSSFPAASISSIEFGASENEIVVTFFNYGVTSVWYTANGGTTWVSKEGNLPDMPVRWCLMNPTANNEVILATEVGVWSTNNFQSASPTWIPSNSGLANVRVDMLQMRASDSEVIAATHGRGLFSSSYLSSVCTYPTSISGTNIGATSADISWVAGSTETAWNIEYGLSGFSQGTGTSASVTTNSYTVSGLSTGFSYDFYVQADCGSGTTSVWAGPYTFSTVCGPITSFPYTMDFESGSPCWSVINGGDANTWTVSSGSGIGGGFSANITYSATAHDDHLISPQFTVTNGVSNRFSFWAKNQSTSYPEDFDVYVSTTGNSAANFTNIVAQNVFPTTGTFTNYSYDLSAFNGQTVYVSIYSNTTDEWLLYIDDVVIDAPCLLSTSIPVTACNSYTWGNTGLTYTSSGSYTDSNTSVGGCDSVVTLNLTINNSNSGSEAITACNTYNWAANSQTYTASGAYTATLTNAAGCDSVATLNLTINGSLSSSETIAACATYTWAANSQTYTSSGIYSTTLTSVGGCDSVVTLNLTINNTNSGSEAITSCNNYTWTANNQTYTTSGIYSTTLTNAEGCDSIATLNLTINGSLSSFETIAACATYTWAANSITYTSSGIYTTTLTSVGGCDSIATLNLTIYSSSSGSEAITACDTYTWATNGQTYSASGAYSTILTNALGCDSVVTLNLTINNSNTGTDIQTACDTYTWIDGVTYSASTSAPTFTLTNAAGCDSVVTLNLTMSYTQIINDSIVYCPGGSQLTGGGTQILGLGLYQDTLTASSGCDSIILTNVLADTLAPLVLTQNIAVYLDANGFVSIVPAEVDNGSFDNCTIDTMYLSETSFDCSQLGQNTVTLFAVDLNGNMASAMALVQVLDTISPTILVQSDTIYINQNGSANITIVDIDAGSSDNCSIVSSMIFPNSFNCAHTNTLQTIYCSVTDSSGNNAATSVQVFIADTLAPVISTDSMVAYLDQSGNASISTSDLISNISDNCGVDSVWLDTNAFDCTAANTYQTVFAFAIDGSNNVSSMMTQVLVLDTITPVVNAVSNSTVYLDANGNASLTPADVENGSTDNCGITNQQLSQASFDCADQGMNEVTYTVTDLSGNSSSTMVVVNVIDNINSITGFTSANSAPTNSMRTYSVDSIANATYFWSVTNGVINAQSGASANVTWYNYSNGTIQVIQTTSNGCSDTLIQDIVLWPLGLATMAAQPFEVSLYPNPARESINLELTRFEKASSLNNIEIFDVAGNIVLSQEKVLMLLGEAHQIETRSLAKGVYFLTLENELATETLRFILQ